MVSVGCFYMPLFEFRTRKCTYCSSQCVFEKFGCNEEIVNSLSRTLQARLSVCVDVAVSAFWRMRSGQIRVTASM